MGLPYSGQADLILHNGRVLSAAFAAQGVTSVAIGQGHILWAGTDEDIARFLGPDTRRLDCEGGAILPGFIDAHMHLYAYAANLLAVNCSPRAVRSIPEVLASVNKRASELAAGAWIRGWGIEEFHLAEGRLPTRWELDATAPKHPVKLVHRSGHACILNSAALHALGISEETPEPTGGLMERDPHTGKLTGYLLEMEAELERREAVGLQHPAQRPAAAKSGADWELEQGVYLAVKRLLSLGITTIHDATPTRALARWDALTALKEAGRLPVRVHNMFAPGDLDELRRRGLGYRSGDESLRVGAAKIMLNETGERVVPSLEQIAEAVLLAGRHGFQVAFHAVEEKAIDAAISAVGLAWERMAWEGTLPSPALEREGARDVQLLSKAGLGEVPPARMLRHRIEHGGLCPYPLRYRMAQAGMMLVTQPAFVREHGDRYRAQLPHQIDSLYPINSYRRDGVEVAFGSDCPVVPPDPMIGIAGAVSRLSRSGKHLGSDERVTAIEALSMYSRAGAFASFDEWRKGRILPGFLADLIVLDHNPWTTPAERLEEIKVRRTLIGGEVVWEG